MPGPIISAVGRAASRITVFLMPSMSMAWKKAWRTRLSLNGFLPFTLENCSSSRFWSMPRKMVRSSGPVSTRVAALLLTRAMSCTGTGSITSTWPDSRAATRVAGLAMGVKMTSCTLPSTLPQ